MKKSKLKKLIKEEIKIKLHEYSKLSGLVKVMDRHTGKIVDKKGVTKLTDYNKTTSIIKTLKKEYNNKDYYVYISIPYDKKDIHFSESDVDRLLNPINIDWYWSNEKIS